MITVSIVINGETILTRFAVNRGEHERGIRVYAVDDGTVIYHHPDDGAIKLAINMLKTTKEQKK